MSDHKPKPESEPTLVPATLAPSQLPAGTDPLDYYDESRLAAMSAGDRRDLLQALFGMSARLIILGARVYRAMERAGDDVSWCRFGLESYLPKVAAGTVLPEAVVKFYRTAKVLKEVAKLPIEQQRKFVAGEPVLLVVREGGQFTDRKVQVGDLRDEQIDLVFADGRVREKAEQLTRLSLPPPQAKLGKAKYRVGNFVVDRKEQTVRLIKGTVGTVQDNIDALRAAGFYPA